MDRGRWKFSTTTRVRELKKETLSFLAMENNWGKDNLRKHRSGISSQNRTFKQTVGIEWYLLFLMERYRYLTTTPKLAKPTQVWPQKGIYLNYFPTSSTPCWPWESGWKIYGHRRIGYGYSMRKKGLLHSKLIRMLSYAILQSHNWWWPCKQWPLSCDQMNLSDNINAKVVHADH